MQIGVRSILHRSFAQWVPFPKHHHPKHHGDVMAIDVDELESVSWNGQKTVYIQFKSGKSTSAEFHLSREAARWFEEYTNVTTGAV